MKRDEAAQSPQSAPCLKPEALPKQPKKMKTLGAGNRLAACNQMHERQVARQLRGSPKLGRKTQDNRGPWKCPKPAAAPWKKSGWLMG